MTTPKRPMPATRPSRCLSADWDSAHTLPGVVAGLKLKSDLRSFHGVVGRRKQIVYLSIPSIATRNDTGKRVGWW